MRLLRPRLESTPADPPAGRFLAAAKPWSFPVTGAAAAPAAIAPGNAGDGLLSAGKVGTIPALPPRSCLSTDIGPAPGDFPSPFDGIGAAMAALHLSPLAAVGAKASAAAAAAAAAAVATAAASAAAVAVAAAASAAASAAPTAGSLNIAAPAAAASTVVLPAAGVTPSAPAPPGPVPPSGVVAREGPSAPPSAVPAAAPPPCTAAAGTAAAAG